MQKKQSTTRQARSKVITANLTLEQLRRADELAERHERSRSYIIGKAIDAFYLIGLQRVETPAEKQAAS